MLTACSLEVDSSKDETYDVLIIEYGEEFESEEFLVMKGEEEVSVVILDLNTKKIGDTDYTINSDDKEEVVTVRVKDTQKPVIEGQETFEITLGDTIDLKEKLNASDPVDGNLELDFTLPKLDEVKDYEVLVTAKDVNGNQTSKKVVISVIEKVEVIEEKPEELADKPTASKPSESKPEASKPAESKPEASKPAESKPEASKPVESKPEAKPEPEPSKPTPKPEPSDPTDGTRVYVSSKTPDKVSPADLAQADFFYVALKLSDGATIQEVVVDYVDLTMTINGKTSDGKSFHYEDYRNGDIQFAFTSTRPNLSDAVVDTELPAIVAQYRAYYRAV